MQLSWGVKPTNMITASKRLTLRHHKPEDIASIFESYTGDLKSARYLARLPHFGIEQTERMLQMLSTPEITVIGGNNLLFNDKHDLALNAALHSSLMRSRCFCQRIGTVDHDPNGTVVE